MDILWSRRFSTANIQQIQQRLVFFCVLALGVCSSPSKGLQSRARIDSGSRTMYNLHPRTYSFTRVRCVPKEDTTTKLGIF